MGGPGGLRAAPRANASGLAESLAEATETVYCHLASTTALYAGGVQQVGACVRVCVHVCKCVCMCVWPCGPMPRAF